ncbi:MAG: GlcG/HbpS family heme-binding protein, partial [Paracoccaceae bacterium]
FAGAHVHETSYRKAWTAVSFRTSTTDLAEVTGPDTSAAAIRDLSMVLALGGGLVVSAGDGDAVAGIGVSGAPEPELDDACAEAGIAAIEMDISF